jgi:TRAP-type C4-dicarboxylate transport system permease small subunit
MTLSDSPAAGEAPGLWRRFTAAYASLLSHLVVASVAILIIPVSLQIFSRHTALIPSYIWTEEMARFLFIWTISIGAMIGVRESTHFEVDVMPELPPRGEAVARLVGRIGILVLSFVFLFAGIKFTEFAWFRTSELAELPLWLIHLPWPLMGLTWIVFLGEQMLDDVLIIAGRKAPPQKATLADIDAGTLNL